MKAFPKVGLLVLVAALAIAAAATSAQAVSINPDNTAVSGTSTNSNLTYGVAFVTCGNATANGNIVHIADDPGTPAVDETEVDRIKDLALEFNTNCAVAGVGPATVDCVGDVTLIAQNATNNTGTVNLNDTFQCDVTTAVCSINVVGPQTTQNNNVALNESTDNLNANVGVQATRTGSVLCGPTSGTATFAADYATSPSNLTIDP